MANEEDDSIRHKGFVILIKWMMLMEFLTFYNIYVDLIMNGPTPWNSDIEHSSPQSGWSAFAVTQEQRAHTLQSAIQRVTTRSTRFATGVTNTPPTTPTSNTGTTVSFNSSRSGTAFARVAKRGRDLTTGGEGNDVTSPPPRQPSRNKGEPTA